MKVNNLAAFKPYNQPMEAPQIKAMLQRLSSNVDAGIPEFKIIPAEDVDALAPETQAKIGAGTLNIGIDYNPNKMGVITDYDPIITIGEATAKNSSEASLQAMLAYSLAHLINDHKFLATNKENPQSQRDIVFSNDASAMAITGDKTDYLTMLEEMVAHEKEHYEDIYDQELTTVQFTKPADRQPMAQERLDAAAALSIDDIEQEKIRLKKEAPQSTYYLRVDESLHTKEAPRFLKSIFKRDKNSSHNAKG